MLTHRFQRWPNIETVLSEFPVFAGLAILNNRTKQETLARRWVNDGPPSSTFGHHHPSNWSAYWVCCDRLTTRTSPPEVAINDAIPTSMLDLKAQKYII